MFALCLFYVCWNSKFLVATMKVVIWNKQLMNKIVFGTEAHTFVEHIMVYPYTATRPSFYRLHFFFLKKAALFKFGFFLLFLF